jgi:hypothetical protein
MILIQLGGEVMQITPGLVITLRHYSLLNIFKGVVLETQENTVIVKLPKEALKAAFSKGDPLVVAYKAENAVEIIGGRLTDYDLKNEQIAFFADLPDEGVNLRSYERYPVSLYADFKPVEGGKKCFALVKDISEHGILIYSRESFFKGQRLNIDIFLSRDIITLTAEIARKTEHPDCIEYGLKIRHNGPAVFNQIKNYVKKAQEEQILKFIIE